MKLAQQAGGPEGPLESVSRRASPEPDGEL